MNSKEARKRAEAQSTENRDNEMQAAPRPFLFSLAYWGPMLAVFSGVLIFIPTRTSLLVQNVSARTPANALPLILSNSVQATVSNERVKGPAVYPVLKLQGVTYRKTSPSALINGRTYFLGDMIGQLKLISISGGEAVLEGDGEQMVLTLDK
jgi:hypothetical protein